MTTTNFGLIGVGRDACLHDRHSEQMHTTGLRLPKEAHDIDALHWLMGSYTAKVLDMDRLAVYHAWDRRAPATPGKVPRNGPNYQPQDDTGSSPVIDVADSITSLMQLNTGMQCAYLHRHAPPDSDRNHTFIGSRGRIESHGAGDNAHILIWPRRTGNSPFPDRTGTIRGPQAPTQEPILPS